MNLLSLENLKNAIHGHLHVHINYQNIIFYWQLARAAPVTCTSYIVATPVKCQIGKGKGLPRTGHEDPEGE